MAYSNNIVSVASAGLNKTIWCWLERKSLLECSYHFSIWITLAYTLCVDSLVKLMMCSMYNPALASFHLESCTETIYQFYNQFVESSSESESEYVFITKCTGSQGILMGIVTKHMNKIQLTCKIKNCK